MKILVNGIGNIGTTLLNCLVEFQEELGITEILANKNLMSPWREVDLDILKKKGVNVQENIFEESSREKILLLHSVNFLFDCTANSMGLANKQKYKSLKNLKGACVQGSEKGFGIPYFFNVNPDKIKGAKYVHIVSCNTHATGYLINSIGVNNILSTDIVTVRRSEDIGNHTRLVTSNVVSRHLDARVGTHHGIDVTDTFKTIGLTVDLTTSDITTPSQLLHSIRFNIKLKKDIDFDKIIRTDRLIGLTNKFDSNYIYELGRRYGFQGRIYNPLIVVDNNLLTDDKQIIGWAYVPQEGNTIISTLAAFLLQCEVVDYEERMEKVIEGLVRKRW